MEYLIPVVLAAIGGYYNKRFPTKIKVIYILVIWIYIFVMLGFRYKVGVDTLSYMYSFRHIKDISDLSLSDITEQRYEPGYLLLCSVCKTLFRDFWVFQMLMAAITNGCIFIFYEGTAITYSLVYSFSLLCSGCTSLQKSCGKVWQLRSFF